MLQYGYEFKRVASHYSSIYNLNLKVEKQFSPEDTQEYFLIAYKDKTSLHLICKVLIDPSQDQLDQLFKILERLPENFPELFI